MKRTILALALALTLVMGVAAQGAAAATAPQGIRLFGLELGMPLGYRLADGAIVSGKAFGIHIPISDSFQVGISSMGIGAGAALTANNSIRLSYTFIPLLGASIYLGQSGANPGAGLGLFSTVLQNASAAGLGTALRLRIDYIFDTTNVAGGSVLFSTAVLFGI
jgi:hypothetical protein